MGYKVKNLIASKPGLAKVTDSELNYQVFTLLTKEHSCETLLYAPVLRTEDSKKSSYLAIYKLDGTLVDKILIEDNSEFLAYQDMDVNKSQGFVITNDLESPDYQEKAAGSVFLAKSDSGSFLCGYNKLLSKIGEIDYKPPLGFEWVEGIDIFNQYLYTVNDNKKIEVYNFNFDNISDQFSFTLNIPDNYNLRNIKVIKKSVYVVSSPKADENGNAKGGIVNKYKLDGTFEKTLINDPDLITIDYNNPWAIVKAPSDFGYFNCSFLLGDGDGSIRAYDRHGKFLGKLKNRCSKVIVLKDLKALKFLDNKLYFARGNIAYREVDEVKTAVIGYIEPYDHCRC